ncbi:MAG TPA: hypothetical protein VFB03_00775 [Candidatus Saccharimonadales bacterium]|nr:hypothetical protein [Candidatus Saccharimonadales bacterium]
MSLIKFLFLSTFVSIAIFTPSLFSRVASACTGQQCIFDQACQGNQNSSICPQVKNQGKKNPVVDTIHTAANIVALVAGVFAVIMIVFSGIMFATAGGGAGGQRATDTNAVKKARATLTGSLIGLLVVVLAWAITRFVVDSVTQ